MAGFRWRVLAMQVETVLTGLALRIDSRAHRLLVHPGEAAPYFGWEVEDGAAPAAAASHLEARGLDVHQSTRDELADRSVADMLWFADPLGNRIELFHGLCDADRPFNPPRPLKGFHTGALGLGHAVLSTPDTDRVLPFYRDVLGFHLSDYATRPFRAVFLHVNARHHSLALLEARQPGLHHLMVEVLSIDDLGRAYDAALERQVVSDARAPHQRPHAVVLRALALGLPVRVRLGRPQHR
jgi:2,3-dihydroxybiphenyl 1,2-dioxygenase